MDRISGEEIARIWHEDSGSGSEHDEAPANMIDFFPADEVQAGIDELVRWATKIINEEIEHGHTSKQTLDEGQELIAKHKHKGE